MFIGYIRAAAMLDIHPNEVTRMAKEGYLVGRTETDGTLMVDQSGIERIRELRSVHGDNWRQHAKDPVGSGSRSMGSFKDPVTR